MRQRAWMRGNSPKSAKLTLRASTDMCTDECERATKKKEEEGRRCWGSRLLRQRLNERGHSKSESTTRSDTHVAWLVESDNQCAYNMYFRQAPATTTSHATPNAPSLAACVRRRRSLPRPPLPPAHLNPRSFGPGDRFNANNAHDLDAAAACGRSKSVEACHLRSTADRGRLGPWSLGAMEEASPPSFAYARAREARTDQTISHAPKPNQTSKTQGRLCMAPWVERTW